MGVSKRLTQYSFIPVHRKPVDRVSELYSYSRSSLNDEKDHDHYFLNRFVYVGEFFDMAHTTSL